MSDKKYKIRPNGRIEALREGAWGPTGTVGGYLLDDAELDHSGHCWIYGDAVVKDRASVSGDVRIANFAVVKDDATVGGHAIVTGLATVEDHASVEGHAIVRCTAIVRGNACISGDASISGDSKILGTAIVQCDMSGGVVHAGEHTEIFMIGVANGYSRCLFQLDGVAHIGVHIGAGCRLFTLADAIKHWSNHSEDRTIALALLESARVITKIKGWEYE